MAIPTRVQRKSLGPLVTPFKRYNASLPHSDRKMGPGEDVFFEEAIYNATDNGYPQDVIRTDINNLLPTSKYIWVISTFGLFIAFEATPNHPNKNRDTLCHSNLTGGKRAYQGGELWFLDDGTVVINYRSGRYGADIDNEQQKAAVIQYFQSVGYANIQAIE